MPAITSMCSPLSLHCPSNVHPTLSSLKCQLVPGKLCVSPIVGGGRKMQIAKIGGNQATLKSNTIY